MLGTVGDILILVAFVACGLSAFAFFHSTQYDRQEALWKRTGRIAWGVMLTAALVASGILVYLLVTHQYQYAYVYQTTSNDLPLKYLISAFWAGQEGSFLLWALMLGGVGVALIRLAHRRYETAVMTAVSFCQLFLLSMIVGLQLGPLAIGQSPFQSIAAAFPEAPIFQQNPNFVPADGTGLNELLQNPWMTIHPPVLFTGFSAMTVPFAFAVAALWQRKYTQWVRVAIPWTLFAVCALGVGIMLGGYWAYVTLSFGGYWAWDPVENSSLVPWLIGLAAFHTMLVQKKSGKSHKAALFLSILAFMFVVYSTFLTRSGVLGDVSVHSFVDLGLYNQLLIWIAAMGVVGFGLFAYRYHELPTPDAEPRILSREFLIFSGAMLFCAIAAVVILGTSSPIFGQVFRDNPSTVPTEFYDKWTLPLAIMVTFLVAVGQLFWWNKMDIENVNRVLLKPMALATACTIGVLLFTPFVEQSAVFPADELDRIGSAAGLSGGFGEFWSTYGLGLQLLLLTFGAFFAFFGNGIVLWRLWKGNPKMAGGAVAHIGFAIMLLGIIASSGFDKPLPQVGEPHVEDGDPTRENFVVARGDTRNINGFEVTYADSSETERGRGQYTLDFVDPQGRSFTLEPVAYEADSGQWFMHPDKKRFIERDIFVAVQPRASTGIDETGDEMRASDVRLTRGDSTVVGDEYSIAFEGFDMNVETHEGVPPNTELSVGATLRVTQLASGETRTLDPVYFVREDRSVGHVASRAEDWDLSITFADMDVDSGEISLEIDGVQVMPEDWVIVQASSKPFISLVWIGFIILTIGFVVAIARRALDLRFSAKRDAD